MGGGDGASREEGHALRAEGPHERARVGLADVHNARHGAREGKSFLVEALLSALLPPRVPAARSRGGRFAHRKKDLEEAVLVAVEPARRFDVQEREVQLAEQHHHRLQLTLKLHLKGCSLNREICVVIYRK